MASQQTVDDLVEYYVNLLIIQYHNLPKAQATIFLLAQIMVAYGVYLDVMNAYNIDPELGPVATGVQLDVIGEHVGVDRYYTAIDLENYCASVSYSEASSLPSSPPAFGCSTYDTFLQPSYNGTLQYNNIITSENALSDDDFLRLIQFGILCNTMNYSAYEIDNALYKIFGNQVWAETKGDMDITYFFSGVLTTLLNTIIFKGLLPAPMGVLVNAVTFITAPLFGLTTYAQGSAGIFSSFAYGCSTYSDYDTLNGQDLTYSNIQTVM